MTTQTLLNKLNRTISVIVMISSLYSCISQKKLEYMQDKASGERMFQLHEKDAIRIKPHDELYIRVSSFDDVAYNFFSSQTNSSNLSFGTDASISLISYAVNDSGYIYFPIMGKIMVRGLTIDQVTTKLKNLLSEYFNQPAVLVKFVNQKITVLGEVRMPGSFTYTKDRINILEALSLAGDITVNGNRKSIFLIRTINDSIVKARIDLTKNDLLVSKYYYLQANDVLYVKPMKSAKWGVVSIPITLVLSTITTFLLVYNYIR